MKALGIEGQEPGNAPLDLSLLSRPVHYYRTIDSTMMAASVLPLGSIVLAEEQTAGQGRHGHSWHSEPFAGIYCSMVLPPTPLLTLALGLATAEAIGIPCDLRWPNDVMIGGKKAAGILVNLVDGKAIAGIGINVNQTVLPPELEATSLRLAAAKAGKARPPAHAADVGQAFPPANPTDSVTANPPLAREPILNALFDAIPAYAALPPDDILRLFTKASSYAAGRRVAVHQPDGVIHGTTAGLNPDGFLIVRKDDGTETLILAGGVRAAGS